MDTDWTIFHRHDGRLLHYSTRWDAKTEQGNAVYRGQGFLLFCSIKIVVYGSSSSSNEIVFHLQCQVNQTFVSLIE